MKRILLGALFMLCLVSPRVAAAEETVMTDSGAVEETSDSSYMTDSGEVRSVSEDGSYMNDSGEMGEADPGSGSLGGSSSDHGGDAEGGAGAE